MFAQRIKQLRKAKNITQSTLAKALHISQQAVAKWEAGKAFPEASVLLRLADFLQVSADSLLGRDHQPQVPVIGCVRAGYNALALEQYEGTEPAAVKDPEQYRYLVVEGDSMQPYIHEGDLALVRLQPVLENGDLGVIIDADGNATLKRFLRKGNSVVLEPFNPAYPTIVLSGEDLEGVHIFGKVIETKKRWD